MAEKILLGFDLVEEDIEEGEIAPTKEAKQICLSMMTSALISLPDTAEFPMPHISSLGSGDIECYWRRGKRRLFFSVSAQGGRKLQRILLGKAGPKTLLFKESPSEETLLSSILWVIGNGEEG
jgi:hypothetical protein